MGKYFGIDGFRGEANQNLTVEHAYKVGRFLGWYYSQEQKARVVIGKGTRCSSYMLHAFRYMGIPRYILTDNMKSAVVGRNLEGHPVWQKDYESYMKTVGFQTKLCKPGHPFIVGQKRVWKSNTRDATKPCSLTLNTPEQGLC